MCWCFPPPKMIFVVSICVWSYLVFMLFVNYWLFHLSVIPYCRLYYFCLFVLVSFFWFWAPPVIVFFLFVVVLSMSVRLQCTLFWGAYCLLLLLLLLFLFLFCYYTLNFICFAAYILSLVVVSCKLFYLWVCFWWWVWSLFLVLHHFLLVLGLERPW